MKTALAAILCAAVLASCSSNSGLRNLQSPGDGPDEFTVLPVRPLVLPPSTTLPPPTPGRANRADPTPLSDAVVALGGNPGAALAGGIPSRDAALVAAAGQNGVDPAIRQTLAQEDAAFRSRALSLNLLNPFGGDRYYAAYASQALDAYAELARFRALGVAVPSAPPAD